MINGVIARCNALQRGAVRLSRSERFAPYAYGEILRQRVSLRLNPARNSTTQIKSRFFLSENARAVQIGVREKDE